MRHNQNYEFFHFFEFASNDRGSGITKIKVPIDETQLKLLVISNLPLTIEVVTSGSAPPFSPLPPAPQGAGDPVIFRGAGGGEFKKNAFLLKK